MGLDSEVFYLRFDSPCYKKYLEVSYQYKPALVLETEEVAIENYLNSLFSIDIVEDQKLNLFKAMKKHAEKVPTCSHKRLEGKSCFETIIELRKYAAFHMKVEQVFRAKYETFVPKTAVLGCQPNQKYDFNYVIFQVLH